MNAPRSFQFKDAAESRNERQVPRLIGIMSPSGGGKTYSALRLATGMQEVLGGDIFGIDTENGRMLHYADQFKFKHMDFTPPFGSLDYLEALRHANKQGARITIVDSMSHEHIGEGGYLETAEAVVDRIAGQDYKKREAVKMLGWAKAGPLRQKMIEGIKQLDGVFIFCFRAKEKTKPIRKEGKTEVVDMGFMPIAGEEWVYEMAVNCMLEPRSEGVPTWRSDHVGERLMMKLPQQFKSIFKDGEPLSEDIGRALAQWSLSGKPKSEAARPSPATADRPASDAAADGAGHSSPKSFDDIIAEHDKKLATAANSGMESLKLQWEATPQNVRKALQANLNDKHKLAAQRADDDAGARDE
jgi:hypothetical protein